MQITALLPAARLTVKAFGERYCAGGRNQRFGALYDGGALRTKHSKQIYCRYLHDLDPACIMAIQLCVRGVQEKKRSDSTQRSREPSVRICICCVFALAKCGQRAAISSVDLAIVCHPDQRNVQ